MGTLVMKFGGTSLGSVEAVDQAASIIMEGNREWEHLIVVVSAMSSTTDALTHGALTSASGDGRTYHSVYQDLESRHSRVVEMLVSPEKERKRLLAVVDGFLKEFVALCHSVHVLGEVTPRAMDAITSLGERINARILAAVLRGRGCEAEAVDATELIITDGKFQNAAPLMYETRGRISERLTPLLGDEKVPIVTGFIGATKEG
ncbi:MAG: aspartate kinase, partial [Anaerolineales bacterium]